jgi:cysteine synthase A
MRFLGAKVVLTPRPARDGHGDEGVELANTHGWFLTRQFENEANPDIHSRTTAREIVRTSRASASTTGSPATAPAVR